MIVIFYEMDFEYKKIVRQNALYDIKME